MQLPEGGEDNVLWFAIHESQREHTQIPRSTLGVHGHWWCMVNRAHDNHRVYFYKMRH
jgi:hypothetical protein